MKKLEQLVRSNILNLKPYSSARDEYQGKEAKVFLDANENPFNNPYNRYPDPLQRDVKLRISEIKGIKEENIFLGNGSDEAIDLVFRIFCNPGIDNVVAIEPTYGMYKVCAEINDVEYRPVLLDDAFQPDEERILDAVNENTKLLFLCSPNNPSGNDLNRDIVINLIQRFDGIVIIDEAYIDFSDNVSMLDSLNKFPNLIVFQTFSKAWGMAGIRLGMAFASIDIIQLMNKVKYPYNVNQLTQQQALMQLEQNDRVKEWVKTLIVERDRLMKEFDKFDCCTKVFPSNANFFLARFENATSTYNYLVDQGIIVRNRSRISLCGNSLRITIGTPEENDLLIETINKMQKK
jgi:histidinol-phosphate aminotransferase